ncbi:replicative DNA helicase [Helicobacter cappadocius]|uniref:Replicative DNA helicase n=1 Tax=Helicobacter cappadocius TaxID=3063998 RepID=A0AA90SSX6_9HELI|nr:MULTISPECIES: replicative DNA helicase [unclassified Helicobacter]MDO7253492.1 replicative DNA helicase [Helicobacter sp. faydin-H75]MDP2539419.1 replicative DNA helicase [Helicobacter sp. faydin-H76]
MLEIPNSHNINIERVVISSIIFDPAKFDEIKDLLEPKDFFHKPHRNIFEACLELFAQDLPLDEDLIRSKLSGNKKISDEEFLYIISSNPIANIEGYIKELKNASIKRDFHSLANFLREKSLDIGTSSEEILDDVEKQIYNISIKNTQSDFRESQEIVKSTIGMIEELKSRGNNVLRGLDTGFRELNRLTTGFNKGELIIIGARPSMGKTALFLSMAEKILLRQGKGVAAFSLEMPAEQLMLRLLSSMGNIPLQDLKVGNLDDSQWAELTRCSDLISSKDFYIDDGSSLTVNQLRSKLRKLKSQNQNIEIAIIDYLQLMKGSSRRNEMARHEEISEISRGLKTLARELDIPIIALSQLNRSLESRDDKKPMLSDLRESGSIEQDADVILFLYRDGVYRRRDEENKLAKLKKEDEKKYKEYQDELKRNREEEHKNSGLGESAELILAKNRNGEVRSIKIQYRGIYTRFEDIAQEVESSYSPTKIDISHI